MIAAEISNLQSLCHAHHSALQWSRGVIAAEMLRVGHGVLVVELASMEPRRDRRGDVPTIGIESSSVGTLQWSRGVIAAEIRKMLSPQG